MNVQKTRTNFMEKAGTGIKPVADACKDNGNQVNFNFSDSFWVTISSNEKVTKDNRVSNIIKIVEKNPNTTVDEIAKILLVNRRTILRDLDVLIQNNVIKRIGGRKTGT